MNSHSEIASELWKNLQQDAGMTHLKRVMSHLDLSAQALQKAGQDEATNEVIAMMEHLANKFAPSKKVSVIAQTQPLVNRFGS